VALLGGPADEDFHDPFPWDDVPLPVLFRLWAGRKETANGVIYSPELELDAGPGPELTFLICPLDRDGNTLHAYVLGKPRMIDVRPRAARQGPVEGDRRQGMAGDVRSLWEAAARGRLSGAARY
jgi:hypothetical protein